jgi:hypothetical protein
MLLFSRFLELVDFSPNPVNDMCNNLLQQMEIGALEQLISEDVKVQGQISCVMVFELASWSLESSLKLLPGSSPEEMRSTTTTLLPGSSLEESALTSISVDRFFLCVEEKNPASPWWVALESANLAHARVYGFLPRADEEPTSSMERRGRRMGRRAGMAPLRHRETSLSWRGWRTAPRKMDREMAVGPPPCRTSP